MDYTFTRKGKKGKYPADYGMTNAYQYYLEHYKNKYDVSQREYSLIFKEVMERIMFKIIFENFEFKMPFTGNLRVKKTPIQIKFNPDGTLCRKGLRVDWKATKDLWKADEEAKLKKQVVYHFNDHNDRCNLKFYYDKRTCQMKNQSAYKLSMSRKWDRLLNEAVKRNPNLNYFE